MGFALIAPAGFRPRGRNPRRHSSIPRVIKECAKTTRFEKPRRAGWYRVKYQVILLLRSGSLKSSGGYYYPR